MKHLFILLFLSYTSLTFSQKNVDLYKIENNILFTNSFELTSGNEVRKIDGFQIGIPLKVKKVNFIISSAIIDIKLKGNSRIFIIGDINYEKKENLKSINTNKFISHINKNFKENQLYIDNKRVYIKDIYPKNGVKLKSQRFHGMSIIPNKFIILYLNVCETDLGKFNKTLKSFINKK